MTRRPASVASCVIIVASLASCAGEGSHYPSLAPRAVEKQSFAEPIIAPAVAAPDPALDAEIGRQGAELDRIAAGFGIAAMKAEKATTAAAHQPVGSDAWLDAQGELATLDGWRGQASALTATIEATGSARAGKLLAPYPTLDALGGRAAAEVDRESETVARIQAMLPAA